MRREPVYAYLPGPEVTEDELSSCAQLFSEHYGVWGKGGPRPPGSRVRLDAARLQRQSLFDASSCNLVTAKIGNVLVGHAFVTNFTYNGHGSVSWITQLVVHAEHRSRGIGSKLCRMAWKPATDDFACGLVSSHPHAVRALERATGRRCDVQAARQHAAGLIAASGIAYVWGCRVATEGGGCTIDTRFFVEHAGVNELTRQQEGWALGELPDGHEFFAFTFNSSPRRR